MEDELVLAHDEVDVGLGFHVEGGGAEDGRVEPGEGLAEVTGLPKTWLAEVAQRRVEKARHCGPSPSARSTRDCEEKLDGGFAVGLGAESGLVGVGPVVDLDEVVFVDELGEGLAVVVAEL